MHAYTRFQTQHMRPNASTHKRIHRLTRKRIYTDKKSFAAASFELSQDASPHDGTRGRPMPSSVAGPDPLRTPSALPSHDAEEQPPDDHLRPPTTWVCYLPSPRPSPLQVARAIKKRSDHHLYGVILWLATPHLSFFPASLALCCVR